MSWFAKTENMRWLDSIEYEAAMECNKIANLRHFSELLRNVCNLQRSDHLMQVVKHGIEHRYGEYVVFAENVATDDGWELFMMVRPTSVSRKFGYNGNAPYSLDPFNWSFQAKGTASWILPAKPLQNEILQLIQDTDSDYG